MKQYLCIPYTYYNIPTIHNETILAKLLCYSNYQNIKLTAKSCQITSETEKRTEEGCFKRKMLNVLMMLIFMKKHEPKRLQLWYPFFNGIFAVF